MAAKLLLALLVVSQVAADAVDDASAMLQSTLRSEEDPPVAGALQANEEASASASDDEDSADKGIKCGKNVEILHPTEGGFMYYGSNLKMGKSTKKHYVDRNSEYEKVIYSTGSSDLLTTPISRTHSYTYLQDEKLEYYAGSLISTTVGVDKANIGGCKFGRTRFHELKCEDKTKPCTLFGSKKSEALVGLGLLADVEEHPYLQKGRNQRIEFCFPHTNDEGKMIVGAKEPNKKKFTAVPVIGGIKAHHWALNVTGVTFKGKTQAGEAYTIPIEEDAMKAVASKSDQYWVAVPDTATGVLQAPQEVLDEIQKFLGGDNLVDCDSEKLPDLVISLSGKDFVLPPAAYLAIPKESDGAYSADGSMLAGITDARAQLAFPPAAIALRSASSGRCALLFGKAPPYPGVFVLGLPFLRYFSPVFDYKERQVLFKNDFSGECKGTGGGKGNKKDGKREVIAMQM